MNPTTENNREERVIRHYQASDLLDSIHRRLEQAGKNLSSLTVEDLGPVDAFHTRGSEATRELAQKGGLNAEQDVLDLGCGIGGAARFLAHSYGCRVTGLDLTQEYVDVANHLTAAVSLADRVQFQQGSAIALPFADNQFDIVWTEHAQMNIADKSTFYKGISRVLKPGGKFLFHDVFLGTGSEPLYPVPWAQEASFSFLIDEVSAREHMEQAGLRVLAWENKHDESLAFFENVLQALQTATPPPLGVHLLMGGDAREKITNYARNLTERRVTVAMGVMEK